MTGSTKTAQQESNAKQTRYERVTMSSLRICEQYVSQLQNIGAVLAAALRNPPITEAERSEHLGLLRATLELTEKYKSDTEADYTLLSRLAHDARGLPSFELTAIDAADLLAQRAVDVVRKKKPRARRVPVPSRSKHRPPAMHA
jgi:hypothetical protein